MEFYQDALIKFFDFFVIFFEQLVVQFIQLPSMVNKNMPRTFGDSLIHSSHIDVLVEEHDSFPLHELPTGNSSEEERKIGNIIAENLVDNGSTLQMGIEKTTNKT
ncbi:hypothetical protein COOONC_09819 [Cooperia oncophora]